MEKLSPNKKHGDRRRTASPRANQTRGLRKTRAQTKPKNLKNPAALKIVDRLFHEAFEQRQRMGMDDQPLAPIEHPLFQMARIGMVSALDRLYFRTSKWNADELLEQLELSKQFMEAELRRVNDPAVRSDRYSWDVAYVRGAVWSMINEKLNDVSANEIAPNRFRAADWRTMGPWMIIALIILVLALFLESFKCEISKVC